MNENIASLKRRIRRLEEANAMLEAEMQVYEMMAHDLASERVIDAICKRFPEIAAKWATYQEPATCSV